MLTSLLQCVPSVTLGGVLTFTKNQDLNQKPLSSTEVTSEVFGIKTAIIPECKQDVCYYRGGEGSVFMT